EFSNALAGLSCRTVGARGGIATREEAEELVAHGQRRPPRWAELPRPPEKQIPRPERLGARDDRRRTGSRR
ncbi:hypothetical protein MYX77_12585, partial [Acidobacteriia bacterium AH_259_A11_L15]|nr:hypothetical protein [Acidobacteriia bacterium AH_259_A11_L15]